jgi:Flp pilus assembly protein TadG
MTRDRGAADAFAIALLAPVALALALLVVFLGRQVDVRAQVRSTAESAAQAAALERSPGAADAAARWVLQSSMVDPDGCERPEMSVDVSRFAPGGVVVVAVRCDVSRRGLGPIRAPARRFTATATATIDPYRSLVVEP